ncbi:P-loop containing nucleoside triphosphate hydrolase protein [Mycotypha africana]|uniref:P-loop containing nucleoside triphosphate hydrolase protein n=1 Tax=Mycotypha africana TaxID=64632 RepID=UPI002301D7EF|nr:P-loop containing nucleoside triphosphate hydrolase protein [Mycotypha africana]KAI8981960.1 P-loop containing nucleoside triphosphate hydrolase protein [Mycotypha africana]
MSSKKSKSSSKSSNPPPPTSTTPGKKLGGKRNIVKSGNANSSKSKDADKPPVQYSSIFGTWTGKTPVSLLHDHCQKSNWEKPEYDIKRCNTKDSNGPAYLGTVKLSQRNKKTAQMQTVTFTPPAECALPTSAEAKHLAATYTLHRILSHMSMHRVLPPQHRDYWRQFETYKSSANQWQYDPDPFNAHAPTAPVKKQRQVPSKEHANAAVPMPTLTSSSASSKKRGAGDTVMIDEKLRREWENLPAVHMTAENRDLVERVLKRSKLSYQPAKHTAQEKKQLIDILVKMGFRAAHADEALDYSKDTADALDWLYIRSNSSYYGHVVLIGIVYCHCKHCIGLHVPEDDLPPNFMLANYNPTMTTVSQTTETLSRNWLLKRMSAIGYPEAICEEALERANEDDTKAIELLQWRLAHGDDQPLPNYKETAALIDKEELEQMLQDEVTALESIYEPSRFGRQVSEEDGRTTYHILFNAKTNPEESNETEKLLLQIIVPKDSLYPHQLPLFIIECEGLPSYLKLFLIKGLMEEAERNLGMPFIYMCAEWLQDHVDQMIAHPPKLRDMTERLTTFDITPQKRHKLNHQRRHRAKPLKADNAISEQLKDALETMHNSPEYVPMGLVRSKLPAHKFKETIIKTVLGNQVCIVSGETGCGKTTQVPQFILDEEILQGRGSTCSIICTQPRKISAIGVAERVAAERCEKIGQSIGYAVRGETKCSANTRCQFVTTGVLLRRLQSDPTLEGISHVMIDEVHERSVDSDFLLIILRDVLKKRKNLKVVLMSATLNQALFSDYFGGAPFIEIPGFTHPVQDFYLEDILDMTLAHKSVVELPSQSEEKGVQTIPDGEWAEWQIPYLEKGYAPATVRQLARHRGDKIDYNLIANTVQYIVQHETVKLEAGALPAVLIFMPGAMEIKQCCEALESILRGQEKCEILPLHANLSPQEQTRVFKTVAPDVRKIVVATNVAETSITIEGVVYVIDSGRVKETQYHASSHMMHLVETWASRASCKQRRGRAGRTRPGQCFKLFTREVEQNKMRAQQVPELLRTPLEQLCLTVKAMDEKVDVAKFLKRAIDPPSTAALESAIRALKQVEAVDPEGEKLTALGKHMANIPADLRISKMLLFGSVFGCLEPMLTIASIMSLKSPFTSPMEKRQEARQAREKFNFAKSDWLADMKAYNEWFDIIRSKGMKAARQFCEENFLSFATLNETQNLRRQYAEALYEIGFYNRSNKEKYNENADNLNLIKSIIFAGLNPNVAKIKLPNTKYEKLSSGTIEKEKEAREIKFFTKDDGRVFLHPSSLMFFNNNYNSSFLTYFSKMATTKTFIRDGTEVPSYGVLFFGGRIEVDHLGRGLKVGEDGWIRFKSWARIGVLVNQLKKLLQLELECKIEDPNIDVSESGVAHTIIALLTSNGV